MLHTSRREEGRVVDQQQPRWRPTRRQLRWPAGIVGIVVLLLLIRLGYSNRVTGFGQYKVNGEVQPFKTLWDWLGLLIVPAVLAVGGYLFTRSESQATREAAERRAQDETLQAYLDQIGQMLLDPNRPLRRSTYGDSLRTLARARTLAVLRRLDGTRKGTVLQFLYESGLIGRITNRKPFEKDDLIVELRDADLSGAVVTGAVLSGVDLKGINLSHADLRGASLSSADLRGTNLREANLSGAYLAGTNLRGLPSAAPDTYPPVDRTRNVDLRSANLKGAILVGADLTGADLSYADLTGADLVHPRAGPYGILAVFEGDLGGREGAAKLLLQYYAGSWRPATNQSGLKGTTLPDGQRYEAWLKVPGTEDALKSLDKARENYDPEAWP
jgi:hypothetical protein